MSEASLFRPVAASGRLDGYFPAPFLILKASGAVCGLSPYALNPRREQPEGLREPVLIAAASRPPVVSPSWVPLFGLSLERFCFGFGAQPQLKFSVLRRDRREPPFVFRQVCCLSFPLFLGLLLQVSFYRLKLQERQNFDATSLASCILARWGVERITYERGKNNVLLPF